MLTCSVYILTWTVHMSISLHVNQLSSHVDLLNSHVDLLCSHVYLLSPHANLLSSHVDLLSSRVDLLQFNATQNSALNSLATGAKSRTKSCPARHDNLITTT